MTNEVISYVQFLPPLWGKVRMGVSFEIPPTFILPHKGGGKYA